MQISVVIPFYNRNELLRGALASVVAQTCAPHEIIVVDDCSAEDIGWVSQEFPQVRVLRLPRNMKAAGARYSGVAIATGTHIATLDSDDAWYPQKLERQVAFAEKIGDLRGIYAHQQWVDEGGGGSVRPQDGPREGEPTTEYLFVRGGFIQSNTLLIERSLYQELCRVNDEFYADDWELVMRADPFHCRIYLQKEVLGQWNNVTHPKIVDPRRISGKLAATTFARDYLPRQACYFTPKAKAAYLGRWLAPRLIAQGQVLDGTRYLALALFKRALSPTAVFKIFVRATCPGLFSALLRGYGALRYKRTVRSPSV